MRVLFSLAHFTASLHFLLLLGNDFNTSYSGGSALFQSKHLRRCNDTGRTDGSDHAQLIADRLSRVPSAADGVVNVNVPISEAAEQVNVIEQSRRRRHERCVTGRVGDGRQLLPFYVDGDWRRRRPDWHRKGFRK